MKLLGAILIMAATTWWGLAKASDYAKRVQHLRQLQQSLRVLETEILFGFTPLAEAFHRISDRHEGVIASLYAEAVSNLTTFPQKSFAESWQAAMGKVWPHTSLRAQERQILIQLGTQLGGSDRNDQVKHIQLALRMLEGEEKEAIEEQKVYPKIFRHLGILSGLLVVILMY